MRQQKKTFVDIEGRKFTVPRMVANIQRFFKYGYYIVSYGDDNKRSLDVDYGSGSRSGSERVFQTTTGMLSKAINSSRKRGGGSSVQSTPSRPQPQLASDTAEDPLADFDDSLSVDSGSDYEDDNFPQLRIKKYMIEHAASKIVIPTRQEYLKMKNQNDTSAVGSDGSVEVDGSAGVDRGVAETMPMSMGGAHDRV
jgi:hypothetical protein